MMDFINESTRLTYLKNLSHTKIEGLLLAFQRDEQLGSCCSKFKRMHCADD
jgi:hypothetical protein